MFLPASLCLPNSLQWLTGAVRSRVPGSPDQGTDPREWPARHFIKLKYGNNTPLHNTHYNNAGELVN